MIALEKQSKEIKKLQMQRKALIVIKNNFNQENQGEK